MSIGDRLKLARKHAGLTQPQLANAMNGLMTQQNISQLELGIYKATEYAVQLATACGVRPEWLVTGEGNMVNMETYELSPDMIAHLKVLQQLPDYAREEVIRDAIKTAELITKATTAANRTKGTGTS
jgi:transcriptional regulator with XRE-family HTH domain